LKIKYKFLIFFLALPLNLFSDQTDEGVELLYQKISELEKEIAELRSQLEENSVLVERSLELQQQRYLDLDSRILELSSIERNIASNSTEEDLVMDNGQEEEKLLYKNALELFEASRYAEALEVFSEVIITYPDGIYTPDAYFWSGELFLAQKMLEDARESYLIIIDKYSDHKRAPDSLYKLGEIAVSLGEGLAAVDYFKSVIDTYPNSAVTQLAKKSLENIQEESNLID